jgi:hypothetical protein
MARGPISAFGFPPRPPLYTFPFQLLSFQRIIKRLFVMGGTRVQPRPEMLDGIELKWPEP